MLLSTRSSLSQTLSTNMSLTPVSRHLSWIHRRRLRVEFVASRIATTPFSSLYHLIRSLKASWAASSRMRAPSALLGSKKDAGGWALPPSRRYCPTLKDFVGILSHVKYLDTAKSHAHPQLRGLPFWAIYVFPRAGRPHMHTSTCEPCSV